MSRQVKSHTGTHTWQARVKRDGISHFLGYFPSKAEADAAEDSYRKERGWTGRLDCRAHFRIVHGEITYVKGRKPT